MSASQQNQDCMPPCRCQYVQRWLDVHEKYFTVPNKSTQIPLASHVTYRTNGPTQVNYYSQPIQYTTRVVPMPSTLQAPHRISPMKPIYD